MMSAAHDAPSDSLPEAALARAFLAAIVEGSDDAIIGKTLDAIITSWNRGAERLYGYTAAEAIERPITLITPPDRPDEIPAIMARLRRGERIDHYETERVAKDGRRLAVSVTISPVRGPDGTLVGASAVARDITERRRLEREREQLLDQELHARQAAERATERIARLQSVTAAFSEALTPGQVATVMVEQGLTLLGARNAMVAQVTEDGEELEIIDAAGYAPERLEGWRRFPLSMAVPLAEVVRSGEPIWPETTARRIARYPHLAQAYASAPEGAWLSVPLVVRGRPIGGISLGFAEPPVLGPADREFILALAQQGAQALDRARLYAAEQAARDEAEANQRRLAFLAETSQILATSLDYTTTLQRVADLTVPGLADWCAVDLVDRDGPIVRVASRMTTKEKEQALAELRRRYPTPIDSPHGYPHVIRTGRPELIADIPDELIQRVTVDPEHARLVRELGFRSSLCVPLIARGQVVGALTLAMAESGRRFGPPDLELAEEFARRVAPAIDNARLYREAHEAVTLRDEFLSIASHELRTPLATLLAHAQLLLRQANRSGQFDQDRVRRSLDSITREGGRLSRLIQQLLDISRLDAGKLRLEPQQIDLRRLADETVASAQARTDSHRITLEGPAELPVTLDPLRIEQVLANLLDNAIKYSPSGGSVDVSLGVGEGPPSTVSPLTPNTQHPTPIVEIAIRDYGLGIAPELRAGIFERFYQAHSASHASGMGLGLYISRQIVELHGGELAAEFPADGGTRFVIRLPARSPVP